MVTIDTLANISGSSTKTSVDSRSTVDRHVGRMLVESRSRYPKRYMVHLIFTPGVVMKNCEASKLFVSTSMSFLTEHVLHIQVECFSSFSSLPVGREKF